VKLCIRRSVIKRFQFFFLKVFGVTFKLPVMLRGRVGSAVGEAALCETSSHPRNFKQVVTGGPELS